MTRKIFSVCFAGLLSLFLNAQQRIINGTIVVPPAHEWMAGLSESADPQDQFCGGILIADDWVMTAAHCLVGEHIPNVHVFFEAYYLSTPLSGYQVRQADSLIIHPQYDDSTMDNDIGLVHLAQPVNISTVRLPSDTDTYLITPGRVQTIMGWGTTDTLFSWNYSDTLLEATVEIVDHTVCNSPISYNGEVTDNMICAGYMAGGTDACQGDSGGPLLTQEGNDWYATGIVSWGYGCASPNLPGIYTKVMNYIDWISQHVDSLQQPPAGIKSDMTNKFVRILYDGQTLNVSREGNTIIQRVELISMNGAMVYDDVTREERKSLNIQTLPRGVYVAKIFTNEGIITKKIVR